MPTLSRRQTSTATGIADARSDEGPSVRWPEPSKTLWNARILAHLRNTVAAPRPFVEFKSPHAETLCGQSGR